MSFKTAAKNFSRLFTVCLMLTMGFVLPAFAELSDEVIVMPKKSIVYEDSSEFNRMNKKFNINLELFGAGPVSFNSSGAQIGFFLDRNSLVQLELLQGKDNYWSYYRTQTYNTVSVNFKKFAGNSFYFKAGGDYSTYNYNYLYESSFSGTNSGSFKTSLLTASFVIGNQWQWDAFTLGCDWVGLSTVIGSSETAITFSNNINSLDKKMVEEDQKFISRSTRAQLLRFYLGATF